MASTLHSEKKENKKINWTIKFASSFWHDNSVVIVKDEYAQFIDVKLCMVRIEGGGLNYSLGHWIKQTFLVK